MKRGKVPLRAALYAALLTAMVYSATQLYVSKANAFGVCCTFSRDCSDPNHTFCCDPPAGASACSPTQRRYCLLLCSGPGE